MPTPFGHNRSSSGTSRPQGAVEAGSEGETKWASPCRAPAVGALVETFLQYKARVISDTGKIQSAMRVQKKKRM